MIHGPCGAFNPDSPCMKDGKCTKGFPKPFCSETSTSNDGYPAYRRRSPEEGGNSYTIWKNGELFEITNAWVVPYSPFLSRTFECHINVEVCHSIKSIKYVCSYVNKVGPVFVLPSEWQALLQHNCV